MEADQVVVALDLHGEEIAHLTLILYLPSFLKLVRELPVERVLVVVSVRREQVVHVTAKEQAFLTGPMWRIVGDHLGEEAVVRGVLREADLLQPREEGALPSSSGLRHPVTGFLIL